jgi:hypothetical protein
MATHDYSISGTQTFPDYRDDLNNALDAIETSNSSSSGEATPVEGKLWYNTTNSVLNVANGAGAYKALLTVVPDTSITTAKMANNAVIATHLMSIGSYGTVGQMLTSDANGGFVWLNQPAPQVTGSGLVGTTTFSLAPDLRVGVKNIGHSDNYISITNSTASVSEEIGFTLKPVAGSSVKVLSINSSGDLQIAGGVIAYSTTTVSDIALKTAVSNISSALEKVSQLNGVEFTRKDSGIRSAGVIAQDVEKVLPQAVTERELPLQYNDGNKYKTVEYTALHSLYIEAIKELKDMVEKQAVQIKELQGT